MLPAPSVVEPQAYHADPGAVLSHQFVPSWWSSPQPQYSAWFLMIHARSVVQVCGLLLDQPSWRSLVEAQPDKARELLGSLLQVFDSRLWHPASGVLLK